MHHVRQENVGKKHTWPLLRPTAIPLRCLTAMVLVDVVGCEGEESLSLGFRAKMKRVSRLDWDLAALI